MKKVIVYLFILLAVLIAPHSGLMASEALVNSQADVDVTGKDAADAREQAMAKAEILALTDLLSKLAPPGQTQEIIDKMDPRKLAALIRGTEVLEEFITENRYRAKVIVSFDADAISNLITKVANPDEDEFVAHTTNAYLILPSYAEKKKAPILWDENNEWWQVWKALAVETLSGDVIVPVGDTSDRIVVDASTLSSATYSTLSPYAIRYGVSDIIILNATFQRKPDMVLNVVKRQINRVRNQVNMLTYRADPQETKETLLERAAQDIISGLAVKKDNEGEAVRGSFGGERNKVMMLASISSMKSWVKLREKISSLAMVDRVEILAISPKQVDMTVHYRGAPESLAIAIDSLKLKLGRHKDYWVITGE